MRVEDGGRLLFSRGLRRMRRRVAAGGAERKKRVGEKNSGE